MLVNTVAFNSLLEGTYAGGTPETTAFSSPSYLFRNSQIVQVQTDFIDPQILKASQTPVGFAIGRQLQIFTPGMLLMGHNNAASTYRLGKLFQVCGAAETLVHASSVIYKPRSSGWASGAISVHEQAETGNGVLYRAVGCRGNMVIAGSAGQLVTVDPTITGLYAAPIAQAIPTFPVPLQPGGYIAETMKSANLLIDPLGADAAVTPYLKSFSFDFGQTISEVKDANAADGLSALRFTARQSKLQLVVGLDSAQAVTWFKNLKAGTDEYHTVSFQHGSSTPGGRKIKFVFNGQLEDVPKADDAGLRTATLTYRLMHPTVDEGEWEIHCQP